MLDIAGNAVHPFQVLYTVRLFRPAVFTRSLPIRLETASPYRPAKLSFFDRTRGQSLYKVPAH